MIIDFVIAVSELAEGPILAVLDSTARTCVLLATRNGPVGEFPVAEEWSAELPNGMCVPARVKPFACVLSFRLFTDLDGRIGWFALGKQRGTRLHEERLHEVVGFQRLHVLKLVFGQGLELLHAVGKQGKQHREFD